jgi:hypothetical protein
MSLSKFGAFAAPASRDDVAERAGLLIAGFPSEGLPSAGLLSEGGSRAPGSSVRGTPERLSEGAPERRAPE